MATGFSMQKLVGLILVVVVIVIVLFFMFMFGPFVDKIREWHLFGDGEGLELGKSNLDQFFSAYEYCKTVEGSGCLCDSGVNLDLEEEESITIKEKSTLGGVRIENNEGEDKNIENVRHCFQNFGYKIDDPGFRLGNPERVVVYKDDNGLHYRPEISPGGKIDGTLRLYRYIRDKNGEKEIYLCFPSYDIEFELCKAPLIIGGTGTKTGETGVTETINIEVKEIASGVLDRIESYSDIINEVSVKYDVDENLIKAVIAQDSMGIYSFVSRCGAAGLMQLIPDTAVENGINENEIYDYDSWGFGATCNREYADRLINERNYFLESGLLNEEQKRANLISLDARFDAVRNIDSGTRYLKMQLDEFGDEGLALVAYVTNPDTVRRYCNTELGLGSCSIDQQTIDYVISILGYKLYLQSI